MMNSCHVFLMGGSSHVGKSTVAQSLAARLGWDFRSTDYLARHPGRPWVAKPRQVPAHVAEHYLLLPTEALLADVLRHYRGNIGPQIEGMITHHAADDGTSGLVMEGSAILPELVAGLDLDRVAAVWLVASEETMRQRIHAGSEYEGQSARARRMIDQFLARTLLFQEWMAAEVARLGLARIDVGDGEDGEAVVERCLAALQGPA